MPNETKSLLEKAKDWAVLIALVMSGMTFKVSYDNHGLSVEIEKKAKELAALQEQSNEFSLAGVNCD
jgi:hypothetical protein